MSTDSIPALLSAILCLLLALIILLGARRSRLNVAFAADVLGMAVFSLESFMMRQTRATPGGDRP